MSDSNVAKPPPRWTTSWPEWYGVFGNVQVVPAEDYDALLKDKAPANEPKKRVIEGCGHALERMHEWAAEGACPICLTAMVGLAKDKQREAVALALDDIILDLTSCAKVEPLWQVNRGIDFAISRINEYLERL